MGLIRFVLPILPATLFFSGSKKEISVTFDVLKDLPPVMGRYLGALFCGANARLSQ
jgi:hypothetical protein